MSKLASPYQAACWSSLSSEKNLYRVGFARGQHPSCAASRESPHPGHDEDDDDEDDDDENDDDGDDDDEDDGDENGDDQNIFIRLSLEPCQNSLHLHRSSKTTCARRGLSVQVSGDHSLKMVIRRG